MLLFNKSVFRSNLVISVFFALGLLLSFDSYGQVGLSGPTTVSQGTSYTYNPSYNGSSTYTYNGPYSYTITGGVVTGTSNTTKSGTCTSVLYSIGINVTWTSSTGSLYFTCNLGSKTINITAPPALQPGTLSPSSQTINYGTTPSIITGTVATGGATTPSYTYQWMNSSDGTNWSDVTGVTTLSYTPPALYATTYYRRKVTETTTSTVAYTSSVLVAVYPQISATISPSTQNINAGTNAATLTSSVSGGNGTYSYQWQSSLNNSTWSNVGTGSTYNPGIVNSATFYKLIVTSNGVNATSNTATVTICSAPAGQITGPSQCMIGSTIQLANSTSGGSWSSSNVTVAKVDASGVVTGQSSGTATITYAVTNACGTTSTQLGINVVPFSAISPGLGIGLTDVYTDTILVSQGATKTMQFGDTLNSAAHTIKNVLALGIIEESNKYIPGDFVGTAVLKLEYGHSSSEIYQVDSIKLTVTYNKNQGTKYNALNYFTFNSAEFTRVTVIRIDAPTTVGGISFDAKQVMLLTNTLVGTRYYQLADNKKPTLNYTNPASGSVPDALKVNWVYPAHTQNNSTQLEWAWLENEMAASYIVNNAFDTSLLFKTSSTRIDLPGGALAGVYAIPLLYGGAGKLYMRVRGVNIMPSGSRSDGPWSGVQYYSFNGHNDSLNWQVTTSFAEEGKRKTVIQYYDGSLRGRQTVTKDNTTDTILIAETFYDGQGRPAVQILPAPGISNIIAYTKNLNKFNSQPDNSNPLDYFDFTTPSLGNYATTALNDSFGTARYYSSQNPVKNIAFNKNIPVANGFAYTVTRFTPDATGRVMRQGGLGDSLTIGTNHATKYFYGTAAQEELNALFGTEVGNYTHYFKNMVQDANGQMSVSYVDMHGRTIATALAGEAPVNLQGLAINDTAIYKNQAGKILTRNLLDPGSNILKESSIESINSILVPFQTQYSFNYQLPVQTLQLPKCSGGTTSYDCKFDLQISISDESGDTNPVVYNYPGISSINFSQALVLPAGSYSVRKTLTINQDSLEKFIQQYNTVGIGLCRSQQFLIDSIAASDSTISGCGITVPDLTSNSCLATLGTYSTYLSNYATSLGYASVNQLSASQVNDIRNQYVNDSSFCASLNPNISSTLESIRRQMLTDMTPYAGQYAMEPGSGTMFNKYNIFSSSGNPSFTQPFYKYPRQLPSSSPDYYLNSFGNIDGSVPLTRLQTMTMLNFEQEFKESWAKSLLPYHPEFKKLKFAEDSLRSVFNYIDSIHASVSTAFSPINTDPFFSVFSPGADKNLIKKYSDTSWQGGFSMWQMAYAEAFGCKTNVVPTDRQNCYTNMPKVFTTTGTSVNTGTGSVTLTSALQLRAWTMYKAFYGQVRTEMVNRYINLRPGNTDTIDNRNLITQGFTLHFPYDNVQAALNNGWTTWYPNQAGIYPMVNLKDSVTIASNHCESYINAWRQALLNCPELAAMNPTAKEQLLNSITSKMVQVCKNGTDGANPYGSSTVSPANAGATYTSFEQVVKAEFLSAGITTSQYCHPYGIEFPKPYGKNPLVTKRSVTAVDTCTCSQFYKLQTEVTAAGYNAYSLTSLNQYLNITYQDTISSVLYQGLQLCSGQPYTYNCRDTTGTCYNPHFNPPYVPCTYPICDTLFAFPLNSPQLLPVFLSCGFNKSNYNCFDCNYFKNLDDSFYVIFGKHPVLTGTITNDTTIFYNDLFAKYVNFKSGLQKTWQYYAERFNATYCGLGGITGSGEGLSICLDRKPLNDTTGFTTTVTPCQRVRNQATIKAAVIYESNKQQAIANFKSAYLAKCLSAAEIFKVTDTIKEYHYTLYYFDQASNLIKTVSPKGVNPIYRQTWLDSVEAAKSNGTQLVPQHNLITRYNYNSLNQVVIQKTPDGGTNRFYYDRLGRIAVSQNAKQIASGNVYSYTKYDLLGRITEVGQITGGSSMTDITAKNESSLQSWFTSATNSRNQITETVYDLPYGYLPVVFPYGVLSPDKLTQQNLRNRVSYSQVINSATDGFAASATYYSYDIHGNVDTLLQDFGSSLPGGILNAMNTSENRYKKIVYNFDLISGKVNQVSYQPGQWDAYYHRYSYDGENRLKKVYSGRDSVLLFLFDERDANYNYYKHGPLAQTELGKLKVQKLDYAYTLQGWIKAVNPVMGGTLANDNDTTEVYPGAQDVYGYGLNYYNKDYSAIGSPPSSTSVLTALATNAAPLYNGNISAMAVNISQLGTTKVYNYKYDQLNRIVAMDVFNGLNVNTGTFTPVNISDYRERISYDANGNILTYQRNGDAARLTMDNLSYFYKANTNQLHKVTDAAADAAPTDYSKYNDLKQGQSDNNYQYDQIGNLVSDASESITNITWTVYGKIESITKNGQLIRYVYDAAGNRILKLTATDTTAYVRDANGNVLSVYSKTTSTPLVQSETHLYGSSRLGISTQHLTPDSSFDLSSGFGTVRGSIFVRGEKLFELSNHLGNVLVTITDRRFGIDGNSDGTIDYFKADIRTANDYYPGGMDMPGRQYNAATNYRNGFNGKEKDIEGAVQYDYGFRIYDPRLVRFKSVDPLIKKYPELTPYQFASNRPIDGVDLDGLEYVTRIHYVGYVDSKLQITHTMDILYYQMDNKTILAHGGTPAGPINAAAYGPEGKGIKHEYYFEDGIEASKPRWESRQNDTKTEITFHGLYSGPGSITKGGINSTNYDFSFKPIDASDAIAKRHDMNYSKDASSNYQGFIEDTRTLAADIQMVNEVQNFLWVNSGLNLKPTNAPTPSVETMASAASQLIMIGALARYKTWKIERMESLGLNKNNTDHMQDSRVTLENYKVSWFKALISPKAAAQRATYQLLKASK